MAVKLDIDMEIPKSCWDCRFSHVDEHEYEFGNHVFGCLLTTEIIDKHYKAETKPKNCSIKPLRKKQSEDKDENKN